MHNTNKVHLLHFLGDGLGRLGARGLFSSFYSSRASFWGVVVTHRGERQFSTTV